MRAYCPICPFVAESNLDVRGSRRSCYRNHLLAQHPELTQRQWADLADLMLRGETPD